MSVGSPKSTAGSSSVTGATGSGKTTTLAAVLDHINRTRRMHIVTIEDPIEILHADQGCIVNQREVGLDTESFLAAIRRVLRQDPDVILIGELRDAETAETALKAAESGHLVFSTMHTIDAAETISRMIEFFPAIKQEQIRSILAGVLRGVISQRLLPRVEGGRVAAVEVMVNNSRISDLIREQTPEEIPDAIAEGQFFDMQTFTQALIELVVAGEIDREVAANAATNRHDFLVALDQALKRKAAGVETDRPVSEMAPEPPKPGDEPDARAADRRPRTDEAARSCGGTGARAGGLGSAPTSSAWSRQGSACRRSCRARKRRTARTRSRSRPRC